MPRSSPEDRARERIAALSPDELWRDLGYRIDDAAYETGLTEDRIWKLMKHHTIRWMQPGKWNIIPRRALAIYLAELYVEDPEPAPKPMPAGARG